jgi:hypothetical protein
MSLLEKIIENLEAASKKFSPDWRRQADGSGKARTSKAVKHPSFGDELVASFWLQLSGSKPNRLGGWNCPSRSYPFAGSGWGPRDQEVG